MNRKSEAGFREKPLGGRPRGCQQSHLASGNDPKHQQLCRLLLSQNRKTCCRAVCVNEAAAEAEPSRPGEHNVPRNRPAGSYFAAIIRSNVWRELIFPPLQSADPELHQLTAQLIPTNASDLHILCRGRCCLTCSALALAFQLYDCHCDLVAPFLSVS